MNLLIGNTYTEVVDQTREDEEIIRSVCTFKYRQYWKKKGKRHPEVKIINICYYRHGGFPTGWAGKVQVEFQAQGLPISLIDERVFPTDYQRDVQAALPPPRPFQAEALDRVLRVGRGIICHATGTGKTVVAGNLIQLLRFPKTLYIVPNLELLHQTRGDLAEWFPDEKIGCLGNSQWKPELITVATPQTLWNRRDTDGFKIYMRNVHLLIIDEAHHVNVAVDRGKISNTWFKSVMRCPAYWRFGFTATPGKPDSPERLMLEAVTGRIIHEYSPGQAITDGFLTQPEIYVHHIDIPDRISDWPAAYEWNLIGNVERNEKIAELALAYAREGKTVLIHVDRVEKHGEVLEKMMGSACRFVWSQTNAEERKQARSDFKSRDLKILIGTVYGEGVDIPNLDVLINAAGGKKDRGTTQKMGRVLRISRGKDVAVVIDFFDADRGMLERHSKERLSVYKSDPSYKVRTVR